MCIVTSVLYAQLYNGACFSAVCFSWLVLSIAVASVFLSCGPCRSWTTS